jgi:hypothetical protein
MRVVVMDVILYGAVNVEWRQSNADKCGVQCVMGKYMTLVTDVRRLPESCVFGVTPELRYFAANPY